MPQGQLHQQKPTSARLSAQAAQRPGWHCITCRRLNSFKLVLSRLFSRSETLRKLIWSLPLLGGSAGLSSSRELSQSEYISVVLNCLYTHKAKEKYRESGQFQGIPDVLSCLLPERGPSLQDGLFYHGRNSHITHLNKEKTIHDNDKQMERCSVFYEKEHAVLSRDEFSLTCFAGQMPAKQSINKILCVH